MHTQHGEENIYIRNSEIQYYVKKKLFPARLLLNLVKFTVKNVQKQSASCEEERQVKMYVETEVNFSCARIE